MKKKIPTWVLFQRLRHTESVFNRAAAAGKISEGMTLNWVSIHLKVLLSSVVALKKKTMKVKSFVQKS